MRNEYYIDPSARTNGNGSLANPFNTVSMIESEQLVAPMIIYIRRGTRERGNWHITHANFVNQTEPSLITSYGDGPAPVLLIADPNKRLLEVKYAQGLTISGIDIVIDTNECNTDCLVYMYTFGNDNGTANTYYKNSVVKYSPSCNIVSKHKVFQIDGNDGSGFYQTKRRANYIGVDGIIVYNGDSGGTVKGPASVAPTPGADNSTAATYRSYYATAKNCSFVNMRGDGIVLHSAEGADSGMHDCMLSAYRYDSERNGVAPYQAGFWYYNCNGCVSTNLLCDGMSPVRTDRMAYDFDNQTSNCVFRYCVSRNNAGGLILCVQNIFMPPGVTNEHDWFVTRGWGNNNNVIEYCMSYNDGVSTDADPNGWFGWYHKVMAFNNINNFTVRNCLFVDTVTAGAPGERGFNASLLHAYLSGGFTQQINIDSNIFYFSNGAAIHTAADESTTKKSISFTKNIMYSGALGESCSQSAFTLNNITMQGNIFKDPKLANTTKNGPSGPLAAKLVTIMRDSPAVGAGTANATPDAWGNTGKNIGWQQ